MVSSWESGFETYPSHPDLSVDPAIEAEAWEEFSRRMQGNFPFFHPNFAGQMLKPPHPIAVAAYLATMMVNPNNHAIDGGPVTSEMEKEAVADLAAMFRLPEPNLGHLTSSGTIANLEALWVGRELAPDKRVVYGANAHYTHGRMCALIGVASTEVGLDGRGHLDLDAVEDCCRRGDVSTVVLTAGATGLGTVDAVDEALYLKERYGIRLHVDAAYGGFFAALAWGDTDELRLPVGALRAISQCDSVVVDPHKHGLQPYGCGAVLFSDPSVGRLYRHDSPYTYFTSEQLHLGEISLECSRAGASAASLWMTLRVLPLQATAGLGPILAAGRRAALDWTSRLGEPGPLRLHATPELDIVSYLPWRPDARAEEIDAASKHVMMAGMHDAKDPVWLSTLKVEPDAFARTHPDIARPELPVSVLRSVLMKPEHELWVDRLHRRVSDLAADAWQNIPPPDRTAARA